MNSHATITLIHDYILNGASVCTDTRLIKPGDIFFALKGDNFDANLFAKEAIDKGALLAIVDDENYKLHGKIIRVKNVLETLQVLSKLHRAQFNIPVLGITGSNGKTTSKELINAVLSKKYNTLCTAGNLNNHIGVPLTLLRMRKDHELAIIEMGANHVGEIALLSSLANPCYGLITNIGKAHIEGFGSFENIIKGKTELFRYLYSKGGSIFINTGNDILLENAPDCPLIKYGIDKNSDISGQALSVSPFLEISFITKKNNISGTIMSQLLGAYNLENILAAIAIGDYFNVKTEAIIKAIEEYSPSNNRSQLKQTANNSLIMDAYNANPTSMKASLENFVSYKADLPKIAILGDMLELGDASSKEHQDITDFISNQEFEKVLLIGPRFNRTLANKSNIMKFEETKIAEEWLSLHKPKNKLILLKGSRGIKLEILEPLL